MSDLIYNISDKPKTIREWVLYAIQQVLAVFVATVLIATICKTPVDACLIGACIGTIIYQLITGFKSPIFISSCGATVSAVCGAMALGAVYPNYLAVVIGGAVIAVVYTIFALVVKKSGIFAINKLFPPTIVGAVTMVIGLNLATFIPTYVQINNQSSNIGVLIAIATMLVVAIASHYFKGFWKTIPFLIGLVFGYIVSLIITLCTSVKVVDLSKFENMRIFSIPDFTFLHWADNEISWSIVGQVLMLFIPVAICALLEHYSDHKVLSNIIGTDLTEKPGLHRTLIGDGVSSFVGTIVCGLPNTSYGESVATVGFSRVASVSVMTLSALMLGAMAFISPIQALIASIPSCVFGGCAIILYGYIAASGLKTLVNNHVDLENNKNLLIVCAVLTVGVSGIFLFSQSFAGVSLAMVIGVLLNLILREKGRKTV